MPPDNTRQVARCDCRSAAHPCAGCCGHYLEARAAARRPIHLCRPHRERVQRAIDADDAWLKAHPTRKSPAASRQSSKPEAIAEEPEPA